MQKLIVEDLHKSFHKHPVLKGVSLSADKGQVTALLGSSGSGKSTLLRCLNQLEQPDSGTIKLDQLEFKFPHIYSKGIINTLRTKVGMVFQQFNLWAHMTLLENLIAAPIHVLKQPKAQTIAEAQALLEKVGMSNKQHHYPSQLSGGQQQRGAIARALMMKPEVMLFDEPTSALDPEMVNEVLKVMRSLAAEGMTMLIASHEINFAREVATHAIFLEQGQIHEQGAAKDILFNPKTKRLQEFLESTHN